MHVIYIYIYISHEDYNVTGWHEPQISHHFVAEAYTLWGGTQISHHFVAHGFESTLQPHHAWVCLSTVPCRDHDLGAHNGRVRKS